MQSQTPLTCYLRFGPRVTATPARLATGSPARLWPDWTFTSKLVSAFPTQPPFFLAPSLPRPGRDGVEDRYLNFYGVRDILAVGGGFGTDGTGAGELTCAIVGDATTAPVIDASDLFFFRVHSLGCGPPHRKIRAAATISARGPTDGREHLAEAITGRTQARVSFVVIGSSLPTTQASCPAPMTARTLPGTRSRVAAVVYGAQELAEMTY